jgi:hypothetical protein
MHRSVTAVLLLLLLSAPAGGAQSVGDAATPSRSLARVARAAVITTPPTIDGRLDDSVWRTAEPLTDFVQRELREGEPVTERTEVRILSDGQALYVGAWLYDRQPAGMVPGEKVRDVALSNSDYFPIILDSYLDRKNGFVFSTTPSGFE